MQDLDTSPAYAQNLSTTTTSSIQSPSNPNKRLAIDAKLDDDVIIVNGNKGSIPSIFSSTNSQMRINPRCTPPKENGHQSGLAAGHNSSSDEESKSRVNPRPALISGSGRSTTSSASSSCQALSPHNNDPSAVLATSSVLPTSTPRLIQHLNNITNNSLTSNNHGDEDESSGLPRSSNKNENSGKDGVLESAQDQDQDDNSNASGDKDSSRALNLYIGRRFQQHDSESLDMDQDSRAALLGEGDDREGANSSIPDNDMDDDYDDDDDSFSMSIQPEVSLREPDGDESFINLNERRGSAPHKPTNFSNSFNLSMFGNSALSVTQTAGGGLAGGGHMSGMCGMGSSSPYNLQQQMTLKHLSKLARPMMIPKAHHQLPGQGSPQAGGLPGGINEGILMKIMMRDPLQGGSCSNKPMKLDGVGDSGFFDHNDS